MNGSSFFTRGIVSRAIMRLRPPARSRRGSSAAILILALGTCSVAPRETVGAQNTAATTGGEVRQIVTFHFQPGRSDDAFAIYEKQLKPMYAGIAPLRRFRGYREAESPEPLDLVVVSSYDGMAGMDAANDALRRPNAAGQSAFALYATLSGMTQSHHDQFVEMLPALSDSVTDAVDLTVFEYIRVAPGAQQRLPTLLITFIRPFERERGLYAWSESGRMLVSDGWDFVRIYGIRSLGDWHRYRERMRNSPHGSELDAMISARKTIILKRDARLSVR